MSSRSSYRRKWRRWHKGYEKFAHKELMKVFRAWVAAIPWDQLSKHNYQAPISNAFDPGLLTNAYRNIYLTIGLTHGARVGKGINLGLKGFVFSLFSSWFERMMITFLQEHTYRRRVTVRRSFFQQIVDIIGDRIDQENDFTAVAEDLHRMVSDPKFYEWQALRIARTEATASANYAATQAGNISGYVMVKEWISAQDKRTRRQPKNEWDHLHMNGKQVLRTDKFALRNDEGEIDLLDYPGDPTGEPGNIINCRCTVAVVPFRDKNGNLVPTK